MKNMEYKKLKPSFVTVGKKRNTSYKLSYKCYGNGKEKIMFFMGYMLAGKYWHNQMEYYINQPDIYTVCEFDYCGTGNSEDSLFYSKKQLASDLIELIEHLNWEKTNIIAISDGCAIAYELSLIAPNLIKTLSLYSIPPYVNYKLIKEPGYRKFLFVDYYSKLYNMEAYELYTRLTISDTFLFSPSSYKTGLLNKDVIYPPSKLLYQSKFGMSLKSKICYFISTIFYKIKPINNEMLLKRKFPIAMYYATNDALLNKENFKDISNKIKPNLIVYCKDSGHCIQVEDTKQFHKLNLRFFEMNSSNLFKNKDFVIKDQVNFNIGYKSLNFKSPFSNMNSILKLIF